ncbi:protein of unknown function UPF0016 [Richelia intracellularis]|nr:protein of unknown function UPF0016 [Richelia intracellularis]
MKIDSIIEVNTPDKVENSPNINSSEEIAKYSDRLEVISPEHGNQKSTVVFGTTFLTIFLAEIGDKTQLSTLLISAESHKPWMVFCGSAMALLTTSLLGVLVGSWMASKLSPKTINMAAGGMLLLISLMLICDVFIG